VLDLLLDWLLDRWLDLRLDRLLDLLLVAVLRACFSRPEAEAPAHTWSAAAPVDPGLAQIHCAAALRSLSD
jgi:hypothetical protein